MYRAHLKSTHPPRFDFDFFRPAFFIAFSGVSQRVEFKNTKNYLKKVGPWLKNKCPILSMSEMFYKRNEKNPCRFFPYFFYCIFLRFSAWGVQKHQKIFVEKITKTSQKNTHPPTWAVFVFQRTLRSLLQDLPWVW
jgi:hypothetical protein